MSFQVKLGGDWKDYNDEEDRILKRAWKSGFQNCKYQLRGQKYEYNFKFMKQINLESHKERDIRPPYKWKQPSKPLVPAGPTMTIKVPPGRQGKTIKVPHPEDKSVLFTVHIPKNAKPGQEMLVPLPPLEEARAAQAAAGGGGGGGGAAAPGAGGGGGWSTGAKVAAGAGAAVVLGAGAVAGVMIAEHGAEGAADIAGDAAADVGAAVADAAADAGDAIADVAADLGVDAVAADAADAVGDVAGDAADWVVDAADTAGDFIMDLF